VSKPDYYLKIDGVEGESNKKGTENQIELLSWSWGETNSGSMSHGTGGGTGRVSMQDFNFTMTVNKATPKLMLYCATGQHVASAILTCRKAGTKEQQDFLIIKFTDLLISSYQVGGSQGDDGLPVDHVSFNYAKVEWEYKEQDTTKGTTKTAGKAGYDLKKLQAL